MKNLNEFKQLILRYEALTIEEIKRKKRYLKDYEPLPYKLTGFGKKSSCTLCQAIGWKPGQTLDCTQCIYYKIHPQIHDITNNYPCCEGANKDTYNAIELAEDINLLLTAYKNRAEYMRTILTSLNIEQP